MLRYKLILALFTIFMTLTSAIAHNPYVRRNYGRPIRRLGTNEYMGIPPAVRGPPQAGENAMPKFADQFTDKGPGKMTSEERNNSPTRAKALPDPVKAAPAKPAKDEPDEVGSRLDPNAGQRFGSPLTGRY